MNELMGGSLPVPGWCDGVWGRRVASLGLGVVLVSTQCLGSWAQAQEVDERPPTIRFDPATVGSVPLNGSAEVRAIVTDESGIDAVRLNLAPGEIVPMEETGDDEYLGLLSGKDREIGDRIEYWITASDAVGNVQSRGFDFDPFVATVGPPDPAIAVADDGGTNWWVIAGAAVSVALLAALAGSGGGDEEDEPRSLCCGGGVRVQ